MQIINKHRRFKIERNCLFSSLICLLLAIPFNILSQDFHCFKYTIEDGLPSNSVYGATQDKKGFIWIFTEKGVSKYDGYEFKNYGLADGLPSLDVWNLSEDSKGRIWVHAISPKLVYFLNDSIHQVKTAGDRIIYPQTFFEDSTNVWFQDRNGTLHFDNDSITLWKSSTKKIIESLLPQIENPIFFEDKFIIYALQNSPHTQILFGVQEVFYCDNNFQLLNKTPYDSEWIKQIRFHNTIPEGKKEVLSSRGNILTKDGGVVVTSTGVGKWFENDKMGYSILFNNIFNCPPKNFRNTTVFKDNSSIQITIGGCGFLVVDSMLNVLDSIELKENIVRRTFKDREGNYWFATSGEGLKFLTGQARNAKSFVLPENKRIVSITGDLKGNIFYGTDRSSIYHLKNEKTKKLVSISNLESPVKGLTLNDKGELYGGDLGNVYKIELPNNNLPVSTSINFTELITPYSKINVSNNKLIGSVKELVWEDENSKLWISNGRHVFSLSFEKRSQLISDLIDLTRVNALVIGESGIVWAGSDNGLYLIKNDSIIDKTTLNDRLTLKINDLSMDKNNVLWAGTEGYGAYGFKNDNIFPVADTKGDYVHSTYVDYENYLWVGTDLGVKQFSLNFTNPDELKLVRKYTVTDGLLSNEINAIFVDSQYIYLGTTKGLTRIKKSKKSRNKTPPILYIKDIRINGVSKPIVENFELTYLQNQLEIDFVGLSYKSFGNLTYEYKLDNADIDWQTTKNLGVRYPNLQPGKYSFRLNAKDIDGEIAELRAPLQIIIHPPWWQSFWIKSLTLLTISGIIFAIYRTRIGQIQKREAEKIRIEKRFSALELQALQAQMNPHFVFNSLNSIQNFVQRNDAETAGKYLAKFSNLMRLFLESSRSKYIKIDKEVRLIKLYIMMEQLRFPDKFDAIYDIEEDIENSNVILPSLLLQPFIENAINHGLFHKREKGYLKISIQHNERGDIICIVKDNGIGRKKCKEIKKQSKRGYKGMALNIIKERIKILSEVDDWEISIETEDLYPDKEETGTRVIIKIPDVE